MSRSLQIGILAFLFILVPSMAQAQEAAKIPPVSLLCTPMVVVEKGANTEAFSLTAGQETIFTCATASLNKEEKRVLLIGKETYEKELPAAVVTEVMLSAEQMVTQITFPAAYRSGAYEYTFSVIDTETKEEIASPNVFRGVLKGDTRAGIKSMNVDKEQYDWKDRVSLHLSLMIPEGMKMESEKLTLHIAVQNQQGGECVVLADNQAVTEAEADYALTLPGQESTCTNALSVTLRQDGSVVDQRILAIGLEDATKGNATGQSEENIFAKIPKALLIGIGLTGVLCLALGGYFMMRRKKPRIF